MTSGFLDAPEPEDPADRADVQRLFADDVADVGRPIADAG
jgi:hypothetical protein